MLLLLLLSLLLLLLLLLSIRRFRKKSSGCSGPRAPFGGTRCAFSLEVASLDPTYKFSEAPEALRARFFARVGRFGARICSPEAAWDVRGLDFRARNGCFSRFSHATNGRRAKRPTSRKHWQGRYERHFGAAARRPKTLKNRPANASNCVWRCERRLRASWEWP